jgi:hypothetical protein
MDDYLYHAMRCALSVAFSVASHATCSLQSESENSTLQGFSATKVALRLLRSACVNVIKLHITPKTNFPPVYISIK